MLKADELNLYELCLTLIDISRLDLIIVPDRDLINVNAFLNLVKEYESGVQGTALSAPDFLRYCQEISKQEAMKQRSIERKDALQLLTIHKSKGLEFDHVFFWYDLTPQTPRDDSLIDCFYQYAGNTFEHLHDFSLTYQYATVLQHSSWSQLTEQKRRRDELEELNTLYVAVTRAKRCLYIMLGFQSTKDWDAFLSESKGKSRLPLLFADSFHNYMSSNGISDGRSMNYGNPPHSQQTKSHDHETERQQSTKITVPTLSPILPPLISDPFSHAVANTERKDIDWKKIWILERNALIGKLVHHYLSFLIRNTAAERCRGLESCFIKYGNIVSVADIRALCLKTDNALGDHIALFDPAFDKVFTEWEIWHQGKEYRIDRLMISTIKKTAWIVDYKTGGIDEPDQLDIYAAALMSLPHFQVNKYAVKRDYLELKGIHL